MFIFEMQRILGNILTIDRKAFAPMEFAIIYIRTIFKHFDVENPRLFEIGAGIGMNLINCSVRCLI